ncbi:MAG: metal-dependent transcriptional regulator [Clostridia bacterium]|nr:metal-dependent transcriptional regulator [Clostridia bacterium]
MISKALEEYVKTMYILKQQKDEIRVTDIAEKMCCSKASVTKSLNNLKEKKLVEYEAYGEIKLTEEAEEIAQKNLEAYDIVYLFLNEILEINNEQAKEEAEKIKSIITDETLNKLARYTHKKLGLSSLDCKYDLNESKCRDCIKRNTSKKISMEKK